MKRLLTLSMVIAVAILSLNIAAFASSEQTAAALPEASSNVPNVKPWWQHAVFYEIYPRSFADAKNKGVGNLAGITAKLDYLQKLGIDAIWITPCYPSPQVDFGYDISDYENIAAEYGTLADFDKLVAEAKKHNIKIIMDLVMNHTSDKSKWFIESRSSKTNDKRNWYVWRDGKANGMPPNNWQSVFGHSAWTYDAKTKQYYYHFFYPQQPDLNWRNPQVQRAMFDVARFWLDRGVSGFRLDAITTLFEDPKLTDNPIEPGKNSFGDPNMINLYNDHLPEGHNVLRQLRALLDSYPDDRVLVGETGGKDVAELSKMYGSNLDEIQLPMNFFFADINKLSAPEFRKQIALWDKNPASGWPVYLFSNHDQQRHYNRYGDGKNNDQIAKLTAALLLTLRGTPLLYYGEEIGMENNDPKSRADVQDPIGKIGWPKEKGRDGERTPMQWTTGVNAGFSTVKPWLPVAANYKTHNVEREAQDPNSILNFYRQLIQLRRAKEAFVSGNYIALNESDANILSYLRATPDAACLVALNMSDKPQQISFNLQANGFDGKQAKVLLASAQTAESVDLESGITLAPYGVCIAQVKPLVNAANVDKAAEPAPIWLARNYWTSKSGLPANFRTMQSAYKNSVAGVKPASRKGLDTLHASGSAEFSLDNLNHIKKVAKGYKIIDVDLRQESHGYLNDSLPVSWYTGENQINWGKTLEQINSDEDARLIALTKAGLSTTYDLKAENNGSGLKTGVDPQSIEVSKTCSEAALCQSDGVDYVRLPVPDDQSPTDDIVDQFVSLVKNSDDNVWFHMHCAAGHGRTTTFLTMLDMMRNANSVSLDDIVSRQYQLGGSNLLFTKFSGWQQPYVLKRVDFIRQFYQYCLDQKKNKFAIPWSKWHAAHSTAGDTIKRTR